MTTVGFGSGSFSSKNPRSIRGKKRKQLRVRNSLLETLEARHLMAAGPQLIGVQPNEGSLIALGTTGANATVLNTSPREIVLRFDDTTALDANTLSGIQFKRSGGDGVLDSAYLSTDLGTNSQVVLDFSASLPGQQGNGLELRFTQVSRTSGPAGRPASWPVLRVDGNRINIEVNVLAGSKTTATDLIRAMTEDVSVASKVLVKRLRGVESTVIADTVPVNQILTLQGANSARVSSNLNSNTNTLQVEFISTRPGVTSRLDIVSRDYGGQGAPSVLVDGQNIRVEVNSNARFATTVQELLDAINNSNEARLVVQGRLVSGASFTRIGGNFATPLTLNLLAGDDVTITPSFVGFGDSDREVIIRFAETLPDDSYLIDILGTGPFALRNVNGLAFNNGVNQSIRFDLDLGTTVQSVVPQPVVRASNGSLSQLRNQIHVYFNDDDLNLTEVVKPIYYQLVYSRDTISAVDDVVFLPSVVSYDATLNRVALTFNRNLDALADSRGNILPLATLRLRVGNEQNSTSTQVQSTSERKEIGPQSVQRLDAGSRFDNAVDLATDLGGAWASVGPVANIAKSAIINGRIENSAINPFPLDFPGANDEQGNRNNRYQQHIVKSRDQDGILVANYNFESLLGTANQSQQLNSITETQKGMVRQIMSLYEKYLGIRFVESDSLGFTIAVGDMQAISDLTAFTPVEPNGPGGLSYATGPLAARPSQLATIIDIQDFNEADQNQFGTQLFAAFMRGIGVLLGLGNADELPPFTVQSNLISLTPEAVFPGNADVIHGQFALRPESKDIDLYRFSIPSGGGRLNLQVSAERQPDSSLLDASLRLYRNEGTSSASRWVEIAANEDYFSKDPRISLLLEQGGDFIIGISAKGNTSYDPNIEDSGIGGKSEGKYQLRIDYLPKATSLLVDANGQPTELDGDGDGRPGGMFNYWFVPTRPDRAAPIVGQTDMSAYTVWVDKTASASGSGTLAAPFNTIALALQDASRAVSADVSGNRVVAVRILGNTQNRAYEIGFNRFGTPLADGASFDVPKNVTVMIDAGVTIKMGRSRISAGSSTVSVDRSGSSLQLLGTPAQRIVLTSIHDQTGVANPDPRLPLPTSGDWGGVDFRNGIDGGDETRTDKERNGLFLNSIIHSEIRYGGGQVVVDGVSQIITPINLIDSRPSIYNNLITLSADAAISATPNSFKESDFLDPRSQSGGLFVPDYQRVGPDIHGNRIVNNSINGLFVKARTGAADTLETITVAARFDDIDITHIFAENLIIDGRAGGGILDLTAPPTTLVDLSEVAGGALAAGTYTYRLAYVDASGNESLASLPTRPQTLGANGTIRLTNLPPITGNLPYVSRRLYRSEAGGSGIYRLVAQLNSTATTFNDDGTQTGVALNLDTPSSSPVNLVANAIGSPSGTIAAGTYNYRLSYIDTFGNESTASLPTVSVSVGNNSSIQLNNLPSINRNLRQIGLRIYRSDATGAGNYRLVRELTETTTSIFDDGSQTGSILNEGTPIISGVVLSAITTGGFLAQGTYSYRIVFVDINGSESPVSDQTASQSVLASSSIRLDNLPVVPPPSGNLPFIARRLFRSDASGTGRYQLVVQLDATSTSFIDSGIETALLNFPGPVSLGVVLAQPLAGGPAGTLALGTYNYRLAFVDDTGRESPASIPTLSLAVVDALPPNPLLSRAIQLSNLPIIDVNLRQTALRIYRSEPNGEGVYRLVSELNSSNAIYISSGTFVDNGGLLGVALPLSPNVANVTLAAVAGGALPTGTYNYRLVFVDSTGRESPASLPTALQDVSFASSIRLENLPVAALPFVGRRLYRSVSSGIDQYSLIASLDRFSTSFLDTGAVTGGVLETDSGKVRPRLDGSLVIDPGIILKSNGARLEVRTGGVLIAEGRAGLPVVLTSLSDRSYGVGGTAETSSASSLSNPVVGDWGGIFVGPGSSASLDYNRLSYAGGTTRIEGGFASFNAIEVHQADFRMANSRIENNASGVESATSPNRGGRRTNGSAAIFVRGSQPVLLNNRINDNGGAAISIDVNSLGPDLVNDPGRQSGSIGRTLDYVENQGPLIDGNRLSRNLLNGMVVRGQTLTTQSVWDDTDIVHIVSSDIVSDNFHTFGGLRLKSAPTESLVVKFGGGPALAGLTATGTPLDFANRIGGSIQIVGQPNFPVLLTALADDSVGSGFGIDGRPAFDTDNNGTGALSGSIVHPTGPETNQGTRIDNDVDPNNPGFFSYFPRAGGGSNFGDTSRVSAQGLTQLFADSEAIRAFGNFIDVGPNGQAVSLENTTITLQPTLESADLVASEGTFVGNNDSLVRWRVESRFDNGVSRLYNTLILSSDQPLGEVNFINYLDEEFQAGNSSLLYVTGTPGQDDFRANSVNNAQRIGFSHGGVYQQGMSLQNATYTGWAANQGPLLQNAITGAGTTFTLDGNINTANLPPIADATLGQAYGVADVTTALAWRVDPNSTSARITSFLELIPTAIQRQATPGSWSGVSMQTYSNDRNVAIVSERESARATAPSANNTPSSAQYLGQIARLATSGDENARLGFEVQGVLSRPSDVDVYSFTANGRTEVWLDIDRTTSSLDTVVELVSANGDILALSDDSFLEENLTGQNRTWNQLPLDQSGSINPLRRSTITQVPKISVSGFTQPRDDYSTNPKDAGMRVVLPGRENEATIYHVRVRSSNQFPGQPANTPALTDPASVGQGRSRGSYQLQIRLDEIQELPGSSVSYADIRFAQNGLTLSGVPRHSPLVGENAELESRPNGTLQTAQHLGNILQTDRRTIAVAGNLSSNTDIDWFSFDIQYQSLLSPLAKYLSTVFDLDYADGIGRADMSMYLFEEAFDAQGALTGRLVQFGENSNILDDRSTSAPGTGTSDLGRGSIGTLDPFIGSVELRAGRYYLALTNRNQVPAVLANRLSTTQDALVRIEPVSSGQLIVEDRVGGDRISARGLPPIVANFLPISNQPDFSSRVDYVLADVPLYLSNRRGENTGTGIFVVNPFTGEVTNTLPGNAEDLRDIAIRPNGDIRSFRSRGTGAADNDANADYINVNAGTGTTTVDGNFNNVSWELFTPPLVPGTPPTQPPQEIREVRTGFDFEALTFMDRNGESGFVVANRSADENVPYHRNILYAFEPSTGNGLSNPGADQRNVRAVDPGDDELDGAGTTVTERGRIFTVDPDETITGIAGVRGVLFAVSDAGRLYRISAAELGANSISVAGIGRQIGAPALAGFNFTGLSAGPENVSDGIYRDVLFGTTEIGQIVAFNTLGELQTVFSNGRSVVSTGVGGLNGLSFSNLDSNLWHITTRRFDDPGHGVAAPNDLSDGGTFGGSSFYFGTESFPNLQASTLTARSGGEPLNLTYNFPGGASGVLESRPFSLSGIAAQDLPMLYFNYFMQTDGGANGGRDSFRVFAIGDTGRWRELNTSIVNNNSQGSWRQQRISLADFAGNEDVRIRFEFSTAANVRRAEMKTVAGNDLRDGQTFTLVTNTLPTRVATFEIDLGYSLLTPGGASLQNGASVTVSGETFAFWNGQGIQPIGNIVRFDAADSATDIAESLFQVMRRTTFTTPRPAFFVNGNKITIQNAATVSVSSGATFVLSGSPLSNPANVRIPVTPSMTAEEVANVVAAAMERVLADRTPGIGTDDLYTTYRARNRYIEVTGINLVEPRTTFGPFSVSSLASSDWSGRTLSNAFEGVYIDDFIVGLAERGESVTGATTNTDFVTVNTAGSEILVGPYQLEIRGGTEYGRPAREDRFPQITLTQAFAPNQQQSVGQTLTFRGSSTIADGQQIVLSDGSSVLTFEFDDQSLPAGSSARGASFGTIAIPFNGLFNESGKVIASRVRDLLNSTAVQSLLKIAAISSDGSVTGQTSETISLVGPVSVSIPASAGTFIPFSFEGDRNTKREQGQVIVENSRISRSAGFGIVLQADAPGPTSDAPNPGSVRNTITLNDQRLIPGAVVMNNELVGNVGGGISIRGGSQTGTPPAPVPFARIVNNTILGGNIASVNPSAPATFGNDFYSQGLLSFADTIIRYDPTAGGGPVPLAGLQVAADALGAPNYSGIGEPTPGQGAVSLGRGGVLVVQFTNNILTGSGDARPDLAIYEVGNSELARVEVSADNINYRSVGDVSFNNRYIDLDAFGFNTLSQLHFVRITDVSSDGSLSGDSVGADIDAVGALSSRPGLIFSPLGVGINVQNSASPTLLNNIIANHSDGIVVDATSTSTVVGATVFQGNSRNTSGSAVPGQFPIAVASTVPLFSDPLRGNLYPVAGAVSIDSTMDSLVDRAALLAVKQPLGLLPSPIIAPSTDINGMLRVDDPNVQTPPGLGERIFKDRGAADRSDFNGPTAFAVNPYDNDALGTDTNPAIGTVEIVNSNQFFFDVQIVDASQIGFQSEGSGIDQRSVTSSSIVLYKNAEILVEGQDYRFGYTSTSNIVRLTPIAGVWENNSVYQIRFINTNESSIVVADPRAIVDGTIYTIQDSTNRSTRFELDTGLRIRVPASFDGFTNSAVDGTVFRVDNGIQRITFELDNNQTVRPNTVAVAFSTQDPPSVLAEKVALAIRSTGLSVNLTATSIGGGELQILGNGIQFIPDNSLMVVSGQSGVTPGYGLQIPTANGLPVGISDGQIFTIQRGNSTVVFELDSNGSGRPNSVLVPLSTVSTAVLANSIVTSINNSILGITATVGENGLISLGNQTDVRVQATSTVLQVVGVPGLSAAIPVRIDLSEVITSNQVATLLINTIAAQNIPGVSLTQLGSTVLIEGARGVAGLGAASVSGIRDLAGNAMRATETNGQTVIDIFLGEGFDYGDAADPLYASRKSSGGPRHRVVNGISLGPTVTADPDARLTNLFADLDIDDGVVVNPFVASFTGSITVDVRGASPSQNVYVNAWIDVNANGVFESTERIGNREFVFFTEGIRQLSMASVSRDARTDVPVAIRVRLSTTPGLGPNGVAPDGTVPDGEVEDWYTTIQRNPYTNPSNHLDVNADGSVSPIDVLQLVNYINNDNTNGRLPFPSTLVAPPYLDVDGDGFVGPLDVSTVITFINLRGGAPEGEGEGEGSSFAMNDMWVSAANTAAPSVQSNQTATRSFAPSQSSSVAGQIKSLDEYLAALPNEIGPAFAVESLEWQAMMPAMDKDSESESDLSVALAIDDLLADWS